LKSAVAYFALSTIPPGGRVSGCCFACRAAKAGVIWSLTNGYPVCVCYRDPKLPNFNISTQKPILDV
jgi:hypothetical protein